MQRALTWRCYRDANNMNWLIYRGWQVHSPCHKLTRLTVIMLYIYLQNCDFFCYNLECFLNKYFFTVDRSKLNVSATIFPVDFRLIDILFPHPRRLCGSSLHLCHFNRYVSLAHKKKAYACPFSIPLHLVLWTPILCFCFLPEYVLRAVNSA